MRFTVLTPTYNRAHTLHRVYDSLMVQDCTDFEWLVIDDGSTDDTARLVRQWAADAPFPVRYAWQENAHKKVALNHGFRLARGEFTVIADSDDGLAADALSIFNHEWDGIPDSERSKYAGIRGLCVDPEGRIVGEKFPTDPLDASPNQLLYRYNIKGEKLSCDRTEILRKFPFPEDVVGYVPEQVLWSQISTDYVCRCVNKVVRTYHDSTDSVSQRLASSTYAKDVDGLSYAYTFVIDHDRRWFFSSPTTFVKAAANRVRFLLHLRNGARASRYRLTTIGGRILSLTFGWLGYILYWRDQMAWRKS